MKKPTVLFRIIPIVMYAFLMSMTACKSDVEFKLVAKQTPFETEQTRLIVDSLYKVMTQEERVAQLYGLRPRVLLDENGALSYEKCRELIPNGIGHLCQFASGQEMNADELRDFVAQLQQWLMEETPSGIPAIFHEEAISGFSIRGATVYPQQLGLACTWNPQLAEQKTRQTAADMRKVGSTMALSPMSDVVRTPYFNRVEESYGEDSYLSARMGVAFVTGLQGDDLRTGVAACSKHFLGYGGGAEATDKEIMEEILLPHEAMIRVAGSKSVMTGYHKFQGTNAVANKELIEDLLRGYVGFNGIMVSDYGSIDQLWSGESDEDLVKKAAAALNAGNELEFCDGTNYSHMQQALDQGLVSEERFEQAVKRALTLKARLGMLDKNAKLYERGHIEFDTPEERQTAYQLASQSIVMMKNDGVLPIAAGKRIALVGPNANSIWAMLGDYTYQAMVMFWWDKQIDPKNPEIVTLRDALTEKLPEGSSIEYQRGCDWNYEGETRIEHTGDPHSVLLNMMMIDSDDVTDADKAVETARSSDIVIAAVGENTTLCGESRHRDGVSLPGGQADFVNALVATGKPVILVVFGGRQQVLGDLTDKCAAVLQAWYPGEEGGNAVADILLGNVSPSGKLSVSYPKVATEEPICYNYSIEMSEKVAYPFGHGLSYTTFDYSSLTVDKSVRTTDKAIRLGFDLTNSGTMDADEVVQIYLSPTSDVQSIKPIQLQGFQRASLKAGEKRRLEFILSPQQFGHYKDGKWQIDPGKYELKVGASSTDIRLSATIELKGAVNTMPLRTVYFAEAQD